jgi:DNA-binding transcriptional LysR family regulator
MLIVASPDYLTAHGTPATPGDLLQHECIRARFPSGSIMPWELGKGGSASRVEVSGRLIVGTTELAAAAAVSSAGLAYVEQREARPFLASGRLIQVLAEWTPPFGSEALYFPRQRLPSAAFRAFIDYVKAWKTGSPPAG